MNNIHNHIKFFTETENDSTVESYMEALLKEKPGTHVEIINEASGGPITNFKITNFPGINFPYFVHHSPNSVHMIASIVTQSIKETEGKIFTLLAGEVSHPPAAGSEILSFPAGGIDPKETVEQAGLREYDEEMSVLKPEWIQSVECLSGKYNSIGRSTEKSYTLHIEAKLPHGMPIEDLDGHIGGLAENSERIRSTVRELLPELGEEVGGNIDLVGLMMVLARTNPNALTQYLAHNNFFPQKK